MWGRFSLPSVQCGSMIKLDHSSTVHPHSNHTLVWTGGIPEKGQRLRFRRKNNRKSRYDVSNAGGGRLAIKTIRHVRLYAGCVFGLWKIPDSFRGRRRRRMRYTNSSSMIPATTSAQCVWFSIPTTITRPLPQPSSSTQTVTLATIWLRRGTQTHTLRRHIVSLVLLTVIITALLFLFYLPWRFVHIYHSSKQ